jgi:hypothetical protein
VVQQIHAVRHKFALTVISLLVHLKTAKKFRQVEKKRQIRQ